MLDFIKDPKRVGSGDDASNNPVTKLFNILYANVDFKTQFDKRYTELTESGLLSTQNFNNIVDLNYKVIEEYMPYHLDKYGEISTMIEWYRNIELLKENFKERDDYFKSENSLF